MADFNKKDIDIVVMHMPLLDTRIKGKNLAGKFIADVVGHALSFVAENERETTKQRQTEGIKNTKLRGIDFGGPLAEMPDNFIEALCLHKQKRITGSQACEFSKLKGAHS